MSAEPVAEEVEFLPEEAPRLEDLDAVEMMWLERENTPFTPTPSKPMRAARCSGIVKNGVRAGKRCGRESTLGTSVCEKHGANLPNVKQAAAARVRELQLRLISLGGKAVDTLEDLMDGAQSEAVRLGATKEVLDRAGVRGGSELDITVKRGQDPAEILRDRLAKMRERSQGQVVDVTPVEEGYDDGDAAAAALPEHSAEGDHDHG